MSETPLFTFPSISLLHDPSDTPEDTVGTLTLTSTSIPSPTPPLYDTFLRLQHTPVSPTHAPTDILIEATRTLRKTSPTSFTLDSEFGPLTIVFPDLHQLIPQDALDLPADVRRTMTWDVVVAEFESEIDRFVSYQKTTFESTPAREKSAHEAGFASTKAYEALSPGAGGPDHGGRVLLVDEANGESVGEVGGLLVESHGVTPGSKSPVEITLPESGSGPVIVRPVSEEYLRDALAPEYAGSTLVKHAATASRLIVTTSTALSGALTSGARSFTQKTQPAAQPMTFQPSTHTRLNQLHAFTHSAATLSAATLGRVTHFAQNAGAKLAGKDKPRDGTRAATSSKPGLLNKSLIAFSTIADGLDAAGRALLGATQEAASTVVAHRYGEEAGEVARKVTGGVRNVGLVYIDASGVSRRAVVKGVAKGMVVGRVKGGGEVVVPGEDGRLVADPGRLGELPPQFASRPSGAGTPPPPPPYTDVNALQPQVRQPTEQGRASPGVGGKGKEPGKWRF